LARASGAAAQTAAIQLHALTYNWTRVMQLANTPPLQSTAPGVHPVSIHQTSPLVRGSKHQITAYYSIYRPRKDERLSRPAWLVTYRIKVPPPGVEPVHVTHPSTNRAQRRVTSLIRPTLLPLRHAATLQQVGCSSNVISNAAVLDQQSHKLAALLRLIELRFDVPLNQKKQVISETFFPANLLA